ncbi:ATPase [Novosphingobium sp.]|uniref:ATPase n=1 Tax=Novosphingobium sp. TaxID=1874826 RepID=UPI00286E3200|nr:ATPase [Novosphingobium sp.]
MTGGSRIVAIGSGAEQASAPAEQPDELLLDTAVDYLAENAGYADWEDEPAPAPTRRWQVPALAIVAALGWTGFFAWANLWAAGGTTPQQAVSLITSWAVPVLLVVSLWILVTRNSREEALRFGQTARLLSDESAVLEARLTVINRELSLAREFLASQSRDLDSLGRVATEKLSTHAARLEALITANGERIDAIASVSSNALDNMEKLRGQLPVIASSAKDTANNIANAGRTAQGQLGEMITAFERLNEFGQAGERHVDSMKTSVDTTLEQAEARIESLHEATQTRFAAIEDKGRELRDALDLHEVDALAAIRSRSSALMEELLELRTALEGQESQSLISLRARLGALRDEAGQLAKSMRDSEATAMQSVSASRERLEASVRETLERLDALDQRALQASRERIATLSEEALEFDARIAERNRLFDEESQKRAEEAAERESAANAALREQIAEMDGLLAERLSAQQQRSKEMAALAKKIAGDLTDADNRIDALAARAGESEASLAAQVQALGGHLANSEQAMSAMNGSVARLTDDSVRLLELLQASNKQTSEDLPTAIASGAQRLSEIETRIHELEESISRAAGRAEDMSAQVADTRTAIGQSLGEIGTLHDGLEARAASHAAALVQLRGAVEALDADSTRLATFSRDEMAGALDKLGEATRDAAAALEEAGKRSISTMADRLASEGTRAFDEALQRRMAEAIGELDTAAARASDASQESARRLRDQLARISELAENLERRVAQARERAEEQVDNDFARRVALITESLNSNAIDIAKAMSSEVTDVAWASYLRGDRGVFTRRAVRLLDTAEARSVAQIYRNDDEFREHVSRYIHDFEAMLRQLLATRDGHALSVTLLSSDMGKLYVALAQAIERLRD